MSISAARCAISGYSDPCLVAMARQSDAAAYEELVMRYRRQLLDYAQRILGSPELAEDAVQLALLRAWSALQRQHEVESVRPWLYRIVHNAALRLMASNQQDRAELDDDLVASHGADAHIERRIAIRSTLESIAALPVRQREALVLTAISGSSHDEAAAALGLSAGAVRGLVHRARASLRAAAAAVMPLPCVGWLLPGRHRPSTPGGLAEAAARGAGVAGGLAKVGAVVLTTSAVVAAGVTIRHHVWLGAGQHHSPQLVATAHRSASGIWHLRSLRRSSSGSRGAGQAELRRLGSPSGTGGSPSGDVTRGTSVNRTPSTAGSQTDRSGTGGGNAGAGGGPATSAGGASAASASVAPGNSSSSTTTSAGSTTSTSDPSTAPSSTTADESSGGTTSSTSQSTASSDTQPNTSSDGTATTADSTGSSTSLNQATDSTAQPGTD